MDIFPPHKSSLPKYHNTYQSAGAAADSQQRFCRPAVCYLLDGVSYVCVITTPRQWRLLCLVAEDLFAVKLLRVFFFFSKRNIELVSLKHPCGVQMWICAFRERCPSDKYCVCALMKPALETNTQTQHTHFSSKYYLVMQESNNEKKRLQVPG